MKVKRGILSSCGTSAGVLGAVAVSAQQMAALAMVLHCCPAWPTVSLGAAALSGTRRGNEGRGEKTWMSR